MKSLINIPVTIDLEISVIKGQKVKIGEKLAKRKSKSRKEKIPLSKILSVKPGQILSFLTKKIGTNVKKGDILAKKSSIFKTLRIISPMSGLLDSIDLKDGSLFLVTQGNEESFEFSPVNGVIEAVSEDDITISFDGKIIEGVNGKGDQVAGSTLFFEKTLDMFNFAAEVIDKIVIASKVTDGARAKLSALGAKAIVSKEFYNDFSAVIQLDERQYRELLLNNRNNHLIIRGNEKRIIISV